MAKRKLKPIEDRDPYAAMVMAAFDGLEKPNVIENNATSQPARQSTESLTVDQPSQTEAIM